MADIVYERALINACEELQKLKDEERGITLRKARLQETINALYPLVYPEAVDINSLSLPNAIRLAIRSAGRPLSAHDLRTKLEDIGFDTSKFENPLANILTAMRRLADSEEMTWIEDAGERKGIPGPELKSVPQQEFPSGTVELRELLGKVADEKKES